MPLRTESEVTVLMLTAVPVACARRSSQAARSVVMPNDPEQRVLRHAAGLPAPINELIGYDTCNRPFESWYAYVSRLIRVNALSSAEIRDRLPSAWVHLACDPFQTRESDATLIDSLPGIDSRMADAKLFASEWIPFPELSSMPTECVRGCPTCLGNGYHSYATQSDLITTCPVHGQPLVQHCPHCNCPLFWHGTGRTLHAFHCPTGCSLTRSHASGLILEEGAALEAAWSSYLHEIEALKQAIVFRAGPLHIGYPPSASDLSGRARLLPAPGLLAALWHALVGQGAAIPALRRVDDQATTRWRIELSQWTHAERRVEASLRDRMLRGFRRGVYWSTVPLTHPDPSIRWLRESVRTHGPWLDHYVTREDDGISWLDVPSHLLTNREVAVLRRLLGEDRPAGEAVDIASYYHVLLLDLLEGARTRRAALDALYEADGATAASVLSPEHRETLRVSDRADAIVSTPSGQWQMRAWAVAEVPDRWRAWIDYRDPAELGDDAWIHIARREDAF